MPKKKFKDTKLGKWLKEKAPDVLDTIGDILPEQGTLGIIKKIIDKTPDLSSEDKLAAQTMVKEMYELEIADRDSARRREVEVKKAGKQDWMMLITGVVGLASFIFTIYAVVYIEDVRENELFIHLMGMIEGVVIGNIFAFYYGATSQDRK